MAYKIIFEKIYFILKIENMSISSGIGSDHILSFFFANYIHRLTIKNFYKYIKTLLEKD